MTDEADYAMVMPFVTTATHGGPHDDESYVCGWEMGALDTVCNMTSRIGGVPKFRQIHTSNVEQAELIAMRYGYGLEVGDNYMGWTQITFTTTDFVADNMG